MNLPSGTETVFKGLGDFLTAMKFWGAYQLWRKSNFSNNLDPHFKGWPVGIRVPIKLFEKNHCSQSRLLISLSGITVLQNLTF